MIGECGEVKVWKLSVPLLPTPAVFKKDVLICNEGSRLVLGKSLSWVGKAGAPSVKKCIR